MNVGSVALLFWIPGLIILLVIVVSLLTKPPEGAAEELDEIAAKY